MLDKSIYYYIILFFKIITNNKNNNNSIVNLLNDVLNTSNKFIIIKIIIKIIISNFVFKSI